MLIAWQEPGLAVVSFALCAVVCTAGCAPVAKPPDTSSTTHSLLRKVTAEATESSYWPSWRGIGGTAVSTDQRLPVRWSGGDSIRFCVSTPGRGNSSPIVWADSIFLTSELDNRALALLCFGRTDGHLRWQTELTTPTGPSHSQNGQASATAATDGVHVVVSFGTAGLFCCDFGGHKLWHRPIHNVRHVWGSASSPILHHGLAIGLYDSQQLSALVAVDLATGKQVWRTPRQSDGCWSSPLIVRVDGASMPDGKGRDELIVNGTGTSGGKKGWVIAYDPRTGKKLWQYRGTTDVVCPTPIVAAHSIISTSGGNGPIFAIRLGGSGDVSERVLWKKWTGGPYVSTGVVYRKRLYLAGDTGLLRCYNAQTGEVLYQQRLGGRFTSSLVAGDGKVYAVSNAGTVFVIAAGDQFKLLAENRMGHPCVTTPALSQGNLYLRTQEHLFAIAGEAPSLATPSLATPSLAADDSPKLPAVESNDRRSSGLPSADAGDTILVGHEEEQNGDGQQREVSPQPIANPR